MDPGSASKLALGQCMAAATLAAWASLVPVHAQEHLAAPETDAVEEIVVTGSRIKKRNLVSTSPVTQVDREEFVFQGNTRVEDLLNVLPQTVADQTSATNNGSAGTATVDLRGLDAVRTLTLLNGRRLPAGTPERPAPDINQIPGILIERVEMLTGGASATYGSDAIAGVVNFITIDDFEGLKFDYQFSQYVHKNSSSFARYVEEAGFELPSKSVSDGETHNLSVMWGMNGAGGAGNLTLYATYREVEGVTQSERDYSACSMAEFDGFFCGGSGTIPDGRFTDFGLLTHPDCVLVPSPTPEDPNAMACNRVPAFDYATGQPTGAVDPDGNPVLMNEPVLPWFGNTSGGGTMPWPGRYDFLVEPGTDQFVNRAGHPNAFYNFAPTNYFMRPDERVSAGAIGHYPIADNAELYVELNYMRDKTVIQLAPSGSFFWPETINCDNPFLSQQQFDLVCARYNLTPADSQIGFIGRRNAEGGSRRGEKEHVSYRGVLGIRGDVGSTWSYDAFLNYGEVTYSELFDEDLSITRMIRAIDAVSDPVSGQPVCRSALDGTDPNCVPWNVFQSGGVTQEALDYITQPLYFDGSTRQVQVNGYMSGDLGDYGIEFPGADEGIKVVVGLEYRDEKLAYNPDPVAESGDVAGFFGADPPVSGSFSVGELFTEASIPIVQGAPAADLVSVDLAYRYSDYSTGVQTDTYKIAGEWMPIPDIRFRASFQHAVRTGNILELFRPLRDSGGPGRDTCEGQTPVSTFEECQRTGVTAAQYGNIAVPSFGDGFQAKYGGNPDLQPEESDTTSFGFILSPGAWPGFTLSADYFDIEVTGAIAQPSSKFIFDKCIETGAARFCDAVNRDPATGLLWIGEGFVNVADTNIGFLRTAGIDVVASLELGMGRFGDLNFNFVATHVDRWEWQEQPGEAAIECAGSFQLGPCQRARPELVTNLRSTWATPWDASLSLLWRHTSRIENGGFDQFGEYCCDLSATDYFDLAGVWAVTDSITVRLGINNIFDEDPPFTTGGSGNTLPETYDALGRYWFAGFSMTL